MSDLLKKLKKKLDSESNPQESGKIQKSKYNGLSLKDKIKKHDDELAKIRKEEEKLTRHKDTFPNLKIRILLALFDIIFGHRPRATTKRDILNELYTSLGKKLGKVKE